MYGLFTYIWVVLGVNVGKSADPSRRDMEISYAGSKRCRFWGLIQTKIQNPNSKIQNPNGAVWGRHKKNED